mmetsp:Transcript_805/g.1518  ORF Transcript_805/g.1518 Transcript_805/m.1518 type:complete len:189 (+) Transcript_805:90-656(+)
MDLPEYLRFHEESSRLHRSLQDQIPGALYSEEERGSHMLVIVGIIFLFLLAFFAANSSCTSPSNEASDESLQSPDPKRRETLEANLFSGKVNTTLQPQSNTSSAMVFLPRQPTKDEECPICCNHFLSGEAYCIVKSCNHLFHNACIEQWICNQHKDICPVCRREVIIGDGGCKEIEMVSNQEDNQSST